MNNAYNTLMQQAFKLHRLIKLEMTVIDPDKKKKDRIGQIDYVLHNIRKMEEYVQAVKILIQNERDEQ